MKLSRPMSIFLLLFGIWSWFIWVTFAVNISGNPQSWSPSGEPTGFLLVHLVLVVVSLVAGTVIGVLGLRGLLASRSSVG